MSLPIVDIMKSLAMALLLIAVDNNLEGFAPLGTGAVRFANLLLLDRM